jgi:phosphocarrier protein HPr
MVKTIQINSKAGLNGGAIAQLVQTASQFESDIFLSYKGVKVNGKSIMGVLSLGIPNQAEVTLEANGEDDRQAIDQLVEMMELLK